MEKKRKRKFPNVSYASRLILIILTAAALVLTMALPAFAEETTSYETEEGGTDAADKATGKASLIVKKTAATASNSKYTFTVTLSDKSVNGEFPANTDNESVVTMKFENGVSTFELADNGIAAAEGLPSGITYEVEIDDKGESISSFCASGELVSDNVMQAVFDTYDPADSSGFGIFDILLVPMGFIIRICYIITHNYAAALLLFALVMQLILLPLGIKQQKNMNRQASLRPKENAIRKKYAGRSDAVTQKKMNDEIMALYQQENFNPASGCLPLLIQLPIIFALFAVVREPLKYITRMPANIIASLTRLINGIGAASPGYEQIGAVSFMREHGAAAVGGLGEHVTQDIIDGMPNFRMFGGAFDLSVQPSSNIWSIYLLIPILTFVIMYGSMKLTRKFTYQPQPATGDKQTQMSVKIMELMSPVMCTYFAFIVPSAIGIYWMYRNVLAFLQQVLLSKLYPTPKFTEEELKEAEREYLGKTKKSKAERDPNRPKPRSLHRIDFDDDDDAPAPPAVTDGGKKTVSPIEAAPLKEDKKAPTGEDKDSK